MIIITMYLCQIFGDRKGLHVADDNYNSSFAIY